MNRYTPVGDYHYWQLAHIVFLESGGEAAQQFLNEHSQIEGQHTLATCPMNFFRPASDGPAAEPSMTLNVREAAQRLGVSKGFLYRLIQEGRVPVIRVGRRVLISVDQLRDFQRRGGTAP